MHATWLLPLAALLARTAGGVEEQSAGKEADGPTYRLVNGSIELIWQLPAVRAETRGIVFVVHPSGNGARRYWKKSAACPACNGLAEKACIPRTLLRAGFGTFIVSAPMRTFVNGFAWTPRGGWRPQDLPTLEWALAFATTEVAAARGAPLFLLSESSGAPLAFALLSRPDHPFRAHLCLIPAAVPKTMPAHAPPTLFRYNLRDERRARNVRRAVRALRATGTPAAELKISPHRVGPGYFASCLGPERVSPALSARMWRALKEGGLLDPDDYLVQFSPFPTDAQHASGLLWKRVLRPITSPPPLSDPLTFQDSDVENCMVLAFSYHGGRCDAAADVLADFLERARLSPPSWPRRWTSAENRESYEAAHASRGRRWVGFAQVYPDDEHA